MEANAEHPYPSDVQRQMWANMSTLTRGQIDNFLINARKRRKRATDTAKIEAGVANPYDLAASMSRLRLLVEPGPT